jgi:hypothetical protein
METADRCSSVCPPNPLRVTVCLAVALVAACATGPEVVGNKARVMLGPPVALGVGNWKNGSVLWLTRQLVAANNLNQQIELQAVFACYPGSVEATPICYLAALSFGGRKLTWPDNCSLVDWKLTCAGEVTPATEEPAPRAVPPPTRPWRPSDEPTRRPQAKPGGQASDPE